MVAALFAQKKLKKGDEIIVPAVSWSTTYLPLQQYGLKVKFIDIDLETLNLDLKQLKKQFQQNKSNFPCKFIRESCEYK